MILGIPFDNLPLLMGIFGMCLLASSIWSFRIKDFEAPKKTQLLRGLIPMLVLLPIGVLLYLIIVEIIDVLIVDPIKQRLFMMYFGIILACCVSLLQWRFDPWDKYMRQQNGKVEYLHPPKSMNKTAED